MTRVLLYSPAIVLGVWTAIVAFWGFDSRVVNAIMMTFVVISIIVAQIMRDKLYQKRGERRNGRTTRGSGPTTI